MTAEFRYEDDGLGGVLDADNIPGHVAAIRGDQAGDWAVIRAARALDSRWTAIDLSASAEPVVGSAAFVIQHPDGQRKRLGHVRNRVTDADDRVVHYLTDTETGSSGAPVFDGSGALIAVHHAGGRPQELFGQTPKVKNEGFRPADRRSPYPGRPALNKFSLLHPVQTEFSTWYRTRMACTIVVARCGLRRSLVRTFQVLRAALARSPMA